MPDAIFSPEKLQQYALQEQLTQAPRPESKDSARLARWIALLGANGADALTTSAALKRGGSEANPAMKGLAQHPMGLLLAKLGIGAGEALLMDLLAKRGATKAANITGFGVAGATGAIAAHNARVGNK